MSCIIDIANWKFSFSNMHDDSANPSSFLYLQKNIDRLFYKVRCIEIFLQSVELIDYRYEINIQIHPLSKYMSKIKLVWEQGKNAISFS